MTLFLLKRLAWMVLTLWIVYTVSFFLMRSVPGGPLDGARKLLWIENPSRPVMMSLPSGKGEIIICTLNLKSRIHKGKPHYDPAAERILLNLLQR